MPRKQPVELGIEVAFQKFRVVVDVFVKAIHADVRIQNLILQVSLEDALEEVMDGNIGSQSEASDSDNEEGEGGEQWGFGEDGDDDENEKADDQPEIESDGSDSDDAPAEAPANTPTKNTSAGDQGETPAAASVRRKTTKGPKIKSCLCKLCGTTSDKDLNIKLVNALSILSKFELYISLQPSFEHKDGTCYDTACIGDFEFSNARIHGATPSEIIPSYFIIISSTLHLMLPMMFYLWHLMVFLHRKNRFV